MLEHFRLRRWLHLDMGRLGDEAVIWGRSIVGRSQLDISAQTEVTRLLTAQDPLRDPFHVYAHKFSVFLPAAALRTEGARRSVQQVIDAARPAHTEASVVFVEPRLRIGVQAAVGLDAVVGKYPAGVALDQARLGHETVITSARSRHARVGVRARVGQTATLN